MSSYWYNVVSQKKKTKSLAVKQFDKKQLNSIIVKCEYAILRQSQVMWG